MENEKTTIQNEKTTEKTSYETIELAVGSTQLELTACVSSFLDFISSLIQDAISKGKTHIDDTIVARGYIFAGDLLTKPILSLYSRFLDYPFKSKAEVMAIRISIKEILKPIIALLFLLIDAKSEEYKTQEPNPESYGSISTFSEMLEHKVDAELLIAERKLMDNYLKEKHKNRSVIIAGLWGIFSSLLGAIIGAWATLRAIGLIKWPF